MKHYYDRPAVRRHFEPGDQVLALLPTPASGLSAKFAGPYVVEERLSDTNYVLGTPDRRRVEPSLSCKHAQTLSYS